MKARFPKFDFSGIRAHWTSNPEFAQYMNAASLIPAYIEPYLLKVMRQARERIDPAKTQLINDVDIFIKQEMQHCRQHLNFNKRLHQLGYDWLKPIEADYDATYTYFLAKKSLRFNLAYSEGFESLSATACLAFFENYNEILEGADDEPTAMWRWHLAEEFEHRTVCSDVYHELSGLNLVFTYFYRVYGYLYAIIHLGRFQTMVAKKLVAHDRAKMTPEELKASITREKYAKKLIGRGFLRTFLQIASPFYNPANRREPAGYRAYLESFEKKYDMGAEQVVAAA
jgi:predicted metal-dependent hydrolase